MNRVLHFTDIHFQCWPSIRQLIGKRIIGTTNLAVMGRAKRFSLDVQRQLVRQVQEIKPDVVLFSGDLTSMSLPSEFELARRELAPILEKFPTFMIPGNHDAYTKPAFSSQRMASYFGKWMHLPPKPAGSSHPTALPTLTHQNITIVGLDPCRPTVIGSAGAYPQWQLDALKTTLSSPMLARQFVILATHYPLLDRRGAEYSSARRLHAASNNKALIAVLKEAAVKPSLIVHGHVHRAYTAQLGLGIDSLSVPTHNPGAAGQVRIPAERRTAGFNVYEIATAAAPITRYSDSRLRVTRYAHDGKEFVAELTPYSFGY